MKRAICISTGGMFQITKDMNKRIEMCLKLDIDGVELLFADVPSLLNFKISKKNLKKLKKLKFNTIHLPFWSDKKRNTFYIRNTTKCIRALKKAYEIACLIKAKNLNLHFQQLKNKKAINKFPVEFTVENLEPKHNLKISDYKRFFNKNKEVKMLLDTSHGLLCNQLEKLVSLFKKRITWIHLSYSKGPNNDHYMLHRINSAVYKDKKRLNVIKKLKCPVIIEVGREANLTLTDFKREVFYVKKWLN